MPTRITIYCSPKDLPERGKERRIVQPSAHSGRCWREAWVAQTMRSPLSKRGGKTRALLSRAAVGMAGASGDSQSGENQNGGLVRWRQGGAYAGNSVCDSKTFRTR